MLRIGYRHKAPLPPAGGGRAPPAVSQTEVGKKPTDFPLARTVAILGILASCSTFLVWGGENATLAKFRAAAQGTSAVSVARWDPQMPGNTVNVAHFYNSITNVTAKTENVALPFKIKNNGEVTADFQFWATYTTDGTTPAYNSTKVSAGNNSKLVNYTFSSSTPGTTGECTIVTASSTTDTPVYRIKPGVEATFYINLGNVNENQSYACRLFYTATQVD